jgi:hypothetical protein
MDLHPRYGVIRLAPSHLFEIPPLQKEMQGAFQITSKLAAISHFNKARGLVGGIPTPLKNMKASWDDYSQYMEKKMFQTTNQRVSSPILE